MIRISTYLSALLSQFPFSTNFLKFPLFLFLWTRLAIETEIMAISIILLGQTDHSSIAVCLIDAVGLAGAAEETGRQEVERD
jgi:hypothetical protein